MSTKHSEQYERGLELLRRIDGAAGEAVVNVLGKAFPDLAEIMVSHAFGEVYSRPGLSLRDRELITLGALAALGNARPQLKVHLHAALNVGLTEDEIRELMLHISVYAGYPAALNGLFAAQEVFEEREEEG